jgi:hypothetical protein
LYLQFCLSADQNCRLFNALRHLLGIQMHYLGSSPGRV